LVISELEPCSRSFDLPSGNFPINSSDVEVQLLLVASFISVLGVVLILVVYRRWWYIRYFCIILRNSTILSFCNEEKDDLKKICQDAAGADFNYDVFVSYSDNDRQWVLDELLPQIEGRDGISVCLHERDFQVGGNS
jgi:TIR domain